MVQSNTEEFIAKAIAVHGDKFDYSEVVYEKATLAVKIRCKKKRHIFEQTPNKHLGGQGCPFCAGKRKTIADRIVEFRQTHGNKYDYSFVDDTRSGVKVKIKCRTHGIFEQTVGAHIGGQGCNRCSGKAKPLSEIRKSLRDLYGRKYKFALVKGQAESTPILVECKKHGTFKKSLTKLLRGEACSKCGTERAANILRKSKTQFVKEAKEVHGNFYDYREVVYKTARLKVSIKCPLHGVFTQTPGAHLNGNACPSCTEHGFKPGEKASIYVLRSEDGSYMKIGIAGDVESRLGKLRKSTPFDFSIIEEFQFDFGLDAFNTEKEAHKIGASANFSGFDGATEWFLFDQKVIDFISEHKEKFTDRKNKSRREFSPREQEKISIRQRDFIEKSLAVHGGKYDYSLVEYKNGNTKVKIKCPDHGIFEQNPLSHKKGIGCSRCSGYKITTEDAIASFRKVHGQRYDYSLVEYKNAKTNVKIKCRLHGVFEQTPDSHKGGSGCSACGAGNRNSLSVSNG